MRLTLVITLFILVCLSSCVNSQQKADQLKSCKQAIIQYEATSDTAFYNFKTSVREVKHILSDSLLAEYNKIEQLTLNHVQYLDSLEQLIRQSPNFGDMDNESSQRLFIQHGHAQKITEAAKLIKSTFESSPLNLDMSMVSALLDYHSSYTLGEYMMCSDVIHLVVAKQLYYSALDVTLKYTLAFQNIKKEKSN